MAKNNYDSGSQQALITLPPGGATNSPFALSPIYLQQISSGTGGSLEPESYEEKIDRKSVV